jgi:hypothetical protein
VTTAIELTIDALQIPPMAGSPSCRPSLPAKKDLLPGHLRILSSQELGQQYEAMTPYEKGYVVGMIDAYTTLRGGPPPAA